MNRIERPRRSTIISPSRYIRNYHWHAFSALVLVGSLLAFVAGYVNTICVVGVFQLPLTALTGSTSKMAIVFAESHYDTALHFFLLIFSFLLGNSISAAFVGGSSFRIQRHYGLVLIMESIVLAFGGLFKNINLNVDNEWKALMPHAYLISLGCGLQNGMCTTFSGAVIRTTHITGIVTDIGLIIGQAIFHKRTRKHLWKLKILVPLYISFCCGSIIGWFAFQLWQNKAFLVPCTIVGCLGLGHICYCKIFLNIKSRKIANEYEEKYDSRKISVVVKEMITEPNIPSDKQSNNTDPTESEDEQSISKTLFVPLVLTVHDEKTNQN